MRSSKGHKSSLRSSQLPWAIPKTTPLELDQVVLSMMNTYGASIPVWIEALSGNSNDKVSFRKSIKEYRKQFKEKDLPYFVADSALYTKESLKELEGVKWVTRVPETVGEAKEHILTLDRVHMVCLGNGYLISDN